MAVIYVSLALFVVSHISAEKCFCVYNFTKNGWNFLKMSRFLSCSVRFGGCERENEKKTIYCCLRIMLVSVDCCLSDQPIIFVHKLWLKKTLDRFMTRFHWFRFLFYQQAFRFIVAKLWNGPTFAVETIFSDRCFSFYFASHSLLAYKRKQRCVKFGVIIRNRFILLIRF